MRVLLLNGYQPADPNSFVLSAACQALSDGGHEVDLLDVHDWQAMSAREREAYHSAEPVVSDEVRDSVARVRAAEAMLFCYPSVAFAPPAALKAWLERVLVPGVGFVFDDRNRLRPGLRNIRRVGTVTTSPHSRTARLRARDAGKRTTARTLRLNCHKGCRITFVSVRESGDARGAERIRRKLRRW